MPRPKERSETPNPLTAAYRTADGRFIQLMMLQGDRYWRDLCHAFGREDLAVDTRFTSLAARREHSAACVEELDIEFGKRQFNECKQILSEIDVPWAPVQRVDELPDDPQVIANGYIGEVAAEGNTASYRLPTVPVQFDEASPVLRRAPELGEHTELVLTELGYDWAAIGQLRDNSIIP